MNKKLAKLKYLPNNFEIIENGDHVVCAVSGKLISLESKINQCPNLIGLVHKYTVNTLL